MPNDRYPDYDDRDDRYGDRDRDGDRDRPGDDDRHGEGDEHERPRRRDRDDDWDDDYDYDYGRRPRQDIPTYLAQAILSTLFCCVPFGIVAIVHAANVSSKMSVGDYRGARIASDKARTWCWVSFILGIIAAPIVIALQLAAEKKL